MKKKIIIGAILLAWTGAGAAFAQETNPLDQSTQEEAPVTAGELVSFALEWADPDTGLAPTLIAKTGTKNPLHDYSYTYPNAVLAQALFLAGGPEASKQLAETFRVKQETRDLPNSFNYRTGLCDDPVISAGPNAYWGISFLRHYQATGDQKWLEAAKQRAEFLLGLQDADGGIRKNPFKRASEYRAKSVEENLSVYAFLRFLSSVTEKERYLIARDAILKWLATSGVYDKKTGKFSVGTYENKVTPIYSTDANAFAVAILGPKILNATAGPYIFGGADTAQRILEGLEAARVTVDYKHPNGVIVKGVTGFDFTDSAGRPGRGPTVSPEFTAQAALAYLVMAHDAKAQGNEEEAKKFIEAVKLLTDQFGRMAARTGRSASLPYSTEKGIRRFAFDNWLTAQAEADTSAVWCAFPLTGFNPFAENGFELRDSLKDLAPWMNETGEIIVETRARVAAAPEKKIPPTELMADQEAKREELLKPPVVYYKAIYEKAKKDFNLARKRAIAFLMTSYNCWIDSTAKEKNGGYEAIGIDQDNQVTRKMLSELPEAIADALRQEYIYYDEPTATSWRLISPYDLNIDYSRGAYYAFEIDGNYKIVKQFVSEADVPEANQADLKSPETQYQSNKGLPEGHLIARYLPAVEVDEYMNILKVYERVDQLPAMISKTPISKEAYEQYREARGEERKKLLAAGIVPDPRGVWAQQERGIYYARILGLDETKRLRISSLSVETGNEIISGTRFSVGEWNRNEMAKLNAVKYEKGLIDGMVIKPRRAILGEKLSIAEPVAVHLGKEVIAAEMAEMKVRLTDLLKKIRAEKDSQVRLELLAEYDMLASSQAWYDSDGFVHLIYNGVKAAEKRVRDLEEAKKRAEATQKRRESILGTDEEGRDLRDLYGRVWLKVINEATKRLLSVEVYDLGGNLETIFSGDIKIDPLTRAVTSDVRTDIEMDKETYQMLGSHTYRTDENGDWVQDIAERIYRGYTPDKKHFIMEMRIFQKDDAGNILYKDGKPQFSTKIEYYTPEGDIAAEVVKNIITTIRYVYTEGGNIETIKEIFIDPAYQTIENKMLNLEDLVKGAVWTRRFRSSSNIVTFKEALVQSLTGLPDREKDKGVEAVLNRLGAEKTGRISGDFLLEENSVTCNLRGDPEAPDEAPYTVFYEPGDNLGRQRMVLREGAIEVPVDWVQDKEVPAKTLSFNTQGELDSVAEIDKPLRADSIFPPEDMKKFKALKIEPDTLLPLSKRRVYRIITDEKDGMPHLSNTVAITTVSYMMPDDVLGRELAKVKYVMLGDETTLHEDSVLKVEKNLLGQETLVEYWKDERGEENRRAIAKKKETVVYEWYKEGMTQEQIREDMEEILKPVPLKAKEKEGALKDLEVAPFGILPGYHTIKKDGSVGEIKYFSGMVEYPRSVFGYKGIKVPYEKEVKPFSLPDGPPIKGVKYGVLNSDYAYYDVHSLNGQLIILERSFIILRLMNMFPIEGERQIEYYDPLVAYSYLKPIKIEKYFAPGKQPKGENPGILIIAVFLGDATIYQKNGWQMQSFLERGPFDLNHWRRSDYFFDANGSYKHKKEHMEDHVKYFMHKTEWHKPFAFLLILIGIGFLISSACHQRLVTARTKRLLMAQTKACSPYRGREEQKTYQPLLEACFKSLGADPQNYTAATRNILSRIASRSEGQSVALQDLYPEEALEFEKWSGRFGRGFHLKDFKDPLTLIALFRIIFDESTEFKGSVPAFRYFLFDKALEMLGAEEKDRILREVQADISVFLDALRSGYRHPSVPALTKDQFFIYDDMKDLFEGKRPGFIAQFRALKGQTKEQKLKYLATQAGKKPTAKTEDYRSYVWLKTFGDKPGGSHFIANTWRFWVFLIPTFGSVAGGGAAMALGGIPFKAQADFIASHLGEVLAPLIKISLPTLSAIVTANGLVILGIAFSLLALRFTLGSFLTAGTQLRSKAIASFWVIFLTACYLWGLFSLFIVYWTVKIIFLVTFLSPGWKFFINAGAIALTTTFIVASFFSLFYVLIAVFGYFEGKLNGVGQVIYWSDVRKRFRESQKRFSSIFAFAKGSVRQKEEQNEAAWKMFWNEMIQDLHDLWKLDAQERAALLYSEKNPEPNLDRPPRNEEAQERIKFYVNSWLMEMPKAENWSEIPTFTAMITAFNEAVSSSFEELNGSDLGATTTKLNYLIGQYHLEWNEFVGRLTEEDLGKFITKDHLRSVSGLRKMPDGLPEGLKAKITKWANSMVQCVEKSCIEACKIRDAFMMYARLFHPEASEAEIVAMTDDKLQIMLNYEGYYKSFTKDSDKAAIGHLMKEYPQLEVYWDAGPEGDGGLHRYDPASGKIELIEVAPRAAAIRSGKPSGLNQAISYARGRTILFFDANCSVRIEDAAKIPIALAEFRDDPRLAQLLFSEFIYNKNYSRIAQAIGFNEETFTSVTQRTLNIFESCGFYGHSAIIKTDAISSSGGLPQDYVSEDILLAISLWKKNYRTNHKEYLMLGKGRETSYFSSLVPFTKWAMGASDAALGRAMPEILKSTQIHIAQKFMLMFSFAFFFQSPLMFLINFLYLWLMLCWGINGFMAVPYPVLFGILGLFFNQAITATGVSYILEREGFLKFPWTFLKLIAKNHFFFASAIPAYSFGFIAGLKGRAVFIISSKGWNLGHLPLKTIWGEKTAVLTATLLAVVLGTPLLYIVVAAKWVPLWMSPMIPFFPFSVLFAMSVVGALGADLGIKSLADWRDEIIPHGDISKMSVIKIQIIYAVSLMVFTAISFVMWGIIFSSLAVKALFLFSILYISTTLSFVIMPLFAHAQAVAIFKGITLSKLWNYVIVPLFAVAIVFCMSSISSGAIESSAETIVYTAMIVAVFMGWWLLQWKLSGFTALDRWLGNHFPDYKKRPMFFKSDVMDRIYFGHQEFLQGTESVPSKSLQKFWRPLFLITLAIVLTAYFLWEMGLAFYSPWFWLAIGIEAFICLILNIKSTQGERVFLRKMLRSISGADLKRFHENARVLDEVWVKLDQDYKKELVKIYDDDVRAKKALAGYMTRCVRVLIPFIEPV
ncbi:MAG TPA: glycosyltransferase family 2 protein [Candidatus Omnitrophota bacterium]|nr:glycosyltransferase family 2 protein [Candidatus Omnitrophota bacterium]